MATRTQVVEQYESLKDDGTRKTPNEIAEALGISRNGVYNHLRRSGIHLNGRAAKKTTRGRVNGRGNAGATAVVSITVRPDIPNGLPDEHQSVVQIRSQIGDAIENVELEMHLKKVELDRLSRQQQQLYHMLTVPLPDPTE